MKLHAPITINGKPYPAGSDVPWMMVYPFFLLHMGMFGASGFLLAYAADDVPALFRFLHGGIAILVYVVFYLAIFGRDEVKWMFLNAALGLLGIYAEIRWLLAKFGRDIDDYPWTVHAIPFLYYVLYTFLLRQLVLDLAGARANPERKAWADRLYVALSVTLYVWLLVAGNRAGLPG